MIRLFGLLLLLSLAGCGDNNPQLKTLELNRAGNKAMQANTFQIAGDKYIEALGVNPFFPQLHSNLGLSFEMQQQAEKAQQSYGEAERLALLQKNAEMLFVARFNQAQLLGKAKKVDEAIALYQSALEIVPSSKEVKTNIELLTQTQQGGGSGQDSKDQKDKNQQQNKDNKDGKDGKDKKDQKNGDDKDKNKDENKEGQDKQNKEKQNKQYQDSAKYKPRPFDGKDLSEGDVKKILGEIKQQETKIRAEFNRKEVKEQPRDKDW